jgi:acyl-CoA synthetase (AMP-forming)/AMP-acid ligase II
MYITQGLHRAVQQQPDEVATVFGARRTTFAQQRDRVSRVAGGLRRLGVQQGDRVAYLGLNSDRFYEYYFAVPWAHAVLIPVNIRWAAAEIAYALQDSQTRTLIVDNTFLPLVEQIRARYRGLKTVIYAGDGQTPDGMDSYEELAIAGPAIPDMRRGGEDMAGLFYTGGTTGFPKGVMLSHRNLLTSVLGLQASGAFPRTAGPTLHVAPMFHLAAVSELMSCAVAGRTQVILPAFDPLAVLEVVRRDRIEALRLIPVMLQILIDHPRFDDFDLSCISSVGYGGSAIAPALLERATAKFPGADFVQVFGQTELSPVTSVLGPEEHAATRRTSLMRSAGRAAPHAEIRIVDERDTELPPGTVGEVVVRGDHVMRGYWNKATETAFALRGGWLHTGDAGYLDTQGYLFIVDRIKDVIITGGENVFSAEVESALGAHPAVSACAVIGVPDRHWGERVHAVVLLRDGAVVTPEELREHAKGLLAGYKCPRSVDFVDALPLSSAGKVLKRELRDRHAAADRSAQQQ